jgi:hypothetical protein
MARRPKLERPPVRRVHIKVLEFFGTSYEGSESVTVYDTTKDTVMRLIQAAMQEAAQPNERIGA